MGKRLESVFLTSCPWEDWMVKMTNFGLYQKAEKPTVSKRTITNLKNLSLPRPRSISEKVKITIKVKRTTKPIGEVKATKVVPKAEKIPAQKLPLRKNLSKKRQTKGTKVKEAI